MNDIEETDITLSGESLAVAPASLGTPVYLHVYSKQSGNNSKEILKDLSQLSRIYRTGVEVFGAEYIFTAGMSSNSGIISQIPKYLSPESSWQFLETILIGQTPFSKIKFAKVLAEIRLAYPQNTYDGETKNSNYFANEFCEILTGKGLPIWIHKTPIKEIRDFNNLTPPLNPLVLFQNTPTSANSGRSSTHSGGSSGTNPMSVAHNTGSLRTFIRNLPPLSPKSPTSARSKAVLSRSKSMKFSLVWRPQKSVNEPIPNFNWKFTVLNLLSIMMIPLIIILGIILIPLQDLSSDLNQNYTYSFVYIPIVTFISGCSFVCWYSFSSETIASKKALLVVPLFHALLSTLIYYIASYLLEVFPLSVGLTIVPFPSYIFFSIIFYFVGFKSSIRDEGFRKRYILTFFGVIGLTFQILVIYFFIYFYPRVGSSLQALFGFLYPLVAFLFRFLSIKLVKTIITNPLIQKEIRNLPNLAVGMQAEAFYPIFLITNTLNWSPFILYLLSKLLILITFLVRFSLFWYRFSGSDRKKLYVVTEAQERFMEYRRVVVTDYFIFVINQIIGILAFYIIGNFIYFGYNQDYYFDDIDWKFSNILVAVYLIITTISFSFVFWFLVRKKPRLTYIFPFIKWTSSYRFYIVVQLTNSILVPFILLLEHNSYYVD